jgi:hypothetical protein
MMVLRAKIEVLEKESIMVGSGKYWPEFFCVVSLAGGFGKKSS